MSYTEMATAYTDETTRARISACCREQAFLLAGGTAGAGTTLAQHIVSGDSGDIDAMIAAVCTGPNWANLADDGAVLAAVQAAWPTVAAARYPAA